MTRTTGTGDDIATVNELAELRNIRDELDSLTRLRDGLIRTLAKRRVARERIASAAGVTRQHTYNIAPIERTRTHAS